LSKDTTLKYEVPTGEKGVVMVTETLEAGEVDFVIMRDV
jgi:hypothetical protein